jgi:hypothetical protein
LLQRVVTREVREWEEGRRRKERSKVVRVGVLDRNKSKLARAVG